MDKTKLWFDCVADGDLDKVKEFVEGGFDVNIKGSDGITALMMASFMGQNSVASYLTSKGAK